MYNTSRFLTKEEHNSSSSSRLLLSDAYTAPIMYLLLGKAACYKSYKAKVKAQGDSATSAENIASTWR